VADGAPAPGFDRVLAALIIGQLGLHGAMAGVRLAAPLEVLRQDGGTLRAGLLMALFALAPVLTAMPAGRLADRRGYHRPLRLAVALTMAGALVAVLAGWLQGAAHLAGLALAAMLCGAGANVGLIAIQRTAGRLARDNVQRMRVFSWLGLAPALANAAGPLLVGVAIDTAGFQAAYAVMLLLPLVPLATSRRVPREAPPAATATRPQGLAQAARELAALPGMRRLLLVNWLMSTAWDVHTFAVPVLGHDKGFNASTIALVLASFTLSVTAVRLVIPLLAHRVREQTVLRGAMLATGGVLIAYPWAGPAWAMAGLSMLLGLALGSVQPMIMSVLHHLTPASRHGEAIALRSMVMNASGAVMPLGFGAAGGWFGVGWLFWAMGAAVGSGNLAARGLDTARRAGAEG
jgi:MFS family permease